MMSPSPTTYGPRRQERHGPPTEFNVSSEIYEVKFAGNDQCLVGGGNKGVQMWRVEDGEQIANMKAWYVDSLTVSRDGRWIAAGTWGGNIFVWDTTTYKQVFAHREYYCDTITVVDFSPSSSRLMVPSVDNTTVIWDVATHKQTLTLHPEDRVIAAKYSPQGDKIATATRNLVQVWDSNNGHLLVEISVKTSSDYNAGLLWFNDHLFVISDNKICQFEASTGLPISDWTVADSNSTSCIALPKHGEFIAYSTKRAVTFWDTSTRTQIGQFQHPRNIYSIALSPNGQFLAIPGEGEKITTKDLKGVLPASYLTPPLIHVSETVFIEAWKQDQLVEVEAFLTRTITTSGDQNHHALANRALVRARLQHSNAAIDDAEKSIKICPSVIGYVAKSVALVGGGKRAEGCRVIDLAFRHCDATYVDLLLLIKAVILFMAGEHDDAVSRVGDLIATVHFSAVVQTYMYLLLGNMQMDGSDYDGAIHSFERAQIQTQYHVGPRLLCISLISGWKFDDLWVTVRQRLCEALYAAGRIENAGGALLKMLNSIGEEGYMSGPIAGWTSSFTHRCLSAPESSVTRHNNAPTLHGSAIFARILREWAKVKLTDGPWENVLATAACFEVSRFAIYQALCERLETVNCIIEAIECLHKMESELGQQTEGEQVKWILDFKLRCREKLEDLGDAAMNDQQYDEAISRYSAALSVKLTLSQALFVKRSKACAARGLWKDALSDANEAIRLDLSSPLGYERKHTALYGEGRYRDAIDALEMMLSKMPQSSHPDIQERPCQYIHPAETKVAIRKAIRDAIRKSPQVLINTTSGRLCSKSEQATAFEQLPIFTELAASITTRIDHNRIKHEVEQYYQYAMLSHKWEDNEPLFEKVKHILVYELEESPTHNKLQTLCKVVRDAGFHWAWSDTCCINKADHFVLQEALVAMFKWYEGSALTVIFLRGAHSPSRRGDLVRSTWNTRAWTFQEYHASNVVRFYNEDWSLYMNLHIPNHKESPEIISEMEEATGVSAQALAALRPGLNDVREKLCLASRRETTLIEDAAYSLFGIFSVSLPVVYGEGDQALGRLLAQLLASSGDTSILAWTGKSGGFNTCLPANITVFSRLLTSHIPSPMTSAEMETITAGLRNASLSPALVTKFYDQLNELRVPSFSGKRMTLPCITFKLGALSTSRSKLERVFCFRAQTTALGIVEIRTEENLSLCDSLYLVHPWIDFLLGRLPIGVATETTRETTDDQSSLIDHQPLLPGSFVIPPVTPQTRTARLAARFGLSFGGRTPDAVSLQLRTDTSSLLPSLDAESLRAPSSLSPMDKQALALRVIARLRQPFGALLLTPSNVAAYRRVATDSLITVQVGEITPTVLNKLIDSVRVLDVL